MAGKDTVNIALKKKIPVLLGYWTVDLPEDGRLAFKADIYDRDAPLIKALAEPPK
jgi:murein L,D-transpeptidase YcbB/YkuD